MPLDICISRSNLIKPAEKYGSQGVVVVYRHQSIILEYEIWGSKSIDRTLVMDSVECLDKIVMPLNATSELRDWGHLSGLLSPFQSLRFILF
jgi:hypothetical protein